jgi:hypothetical protein
MKCDFGVSLELDVLYGSMFCWKTKSEKELGLIKTKNENTVCPPPFEQKLRSRRKDAIQCGKCRSCNDIHVVLHLELRKRRPRSPSTPASNNKATQGSIQTLAKN